MDTQEIPTTTIRGIPVRELDEYHEREAAIPTAVAMLSLAVAIVANRHDYIQPGGEGI